MKTQPSAFTDDFDDPLITTEEDEEAHEEDLWLSRLIPDFNCSRKLKLKRWNFTLALHQRVKFPDLHSPAALVRFTRNLSRLR